MSTIEEQLELEQQMIDYGINRFQSITESAEEQGRGAETTYARTLTKALISPLTEGIEEYKTTKVVGIAAKYRKLIKDIESEKVAYFVLKAVFNHFMKEETVQTLALSIGWYIEDELKFSKFQSQHKHYYDTILEDFKRKGTRNYRWMHRVLTFKANEKEVTWVDWTPEERLKIGTAMLNIVFAQTDLIERKTITRSSRKSKVIIIPTDSAKEWVNTHIHNMAMLNPDKVPCVIQPDDWVSHDQGGFYSPRMRMRNPLVKTRSKEHRDLLSTADLSMVTRAVNALQATPWQVNTQVLEVMRTVWDRSLGIGLPRSEPLEIPPSPVDRDLSKDAMSTDERQRFDDWRQEAALLHTMEKERVSKCFQVGRVMRMAGEYDSIGVFWYVHQCDFRGRMYAASSGMSPQGPDFAKGLLQLSNAKPLGDEEGMYWLKVHGANTYGEDKESYDRRVQWVEENAEAIIHAAKNPIDNRDFWGNADKPWQFLSFCFEFRDATENPDTFVSRIAIALDGSCNGLQNFSAMLRDKVGGTATNLTISDKPADIYAEVSELLTEKIQLSTDEYAEGWRNFARDMNNGTLSRSLSKRPVMTLPYGSTRQSCGDYVFKYLMETAPEYFPVEDRYARCMWLRGHLWDAISEVVVAAREGMDWLQNISGILAKENKPVLWCTVAGFPVYQGTRKFKSRQIDTQLGGRLQFKFGTEGDSLDVRKQKSGISPNFVHSMDACHLMLALNKGLDEGLTDFACIHDDFGVHACDTAKWHRIIRESFVEMYSEDVLENLRSGLMDMYDVELPNIPDKGDLNLSEVLDSPYFFG